MPPRDQPSPPNRSRRRQETMPGGWLWVIVLLLLGIVMWVTVGGPSYGTIDFSDFEKLVKKDQVKKVTFREGARVLIAEVDEKNIDNPEVKEQVRNGRVEVRYPEPS